MRWRLHVVISEFFHRSYSSCLWKLCDALRNRKCYHIINAIHDTRISPPPPHTHTDKSKKSIKVNKSKKVRNQWFYVLYFCLTLNTFIWADLLSEKEILYYITLFSSSSYLFIISHTAHFMPRIPRIVTDWQRRSHGYFSEQHSGYPKKIS